MFKKIILVLVVLVSIFWFRFSFAEVIINEIMYAPSSTGHEWIELFNDGDEDIDLNDWRFFYDSNSDGIYDNDESHPFTLKQGSSSVLSQHSYAIIAKSNLADYQWLDFSGLIFTVSSLSLSDNGKLIAIMDSDKNVKVSLNYDTNKGGGKDSGTSLSKIESDWSAGIPTPGKVNQEFQNVVTGGGGGGGGGGGTVVTTASTEEKTTETKAKTKVVEVPSIKAKILSNTLAFAGQPLDFKASLLGYTNEKLVLGKLFWNFGDGTSLEQINKFDKFQHTYFYPGEYAVSLEYYSSSFDVEPVAENKIIMKVIPMTVSISRVGDFRDFFVELTNNSTSDINISNWILKANGKVFIFPKNSVVLAKKQMIISGKFTGFVASDGSDLKLLMPDNTLISDYNRALVPIVSVQNKKINSELIKKDDNIAPIPNTEIPVEDLSANALAGEKILETNYSTKTLYYFSFGMLLLVSGVGVYFLRRKKKIVAEGDDFEILDE